MSNIFFTRYMSQTDYGLYSNYYSIVALLVPFVGMNLYFALSNAYIDYKDVIHKYRSSMLLLSNIGVIITAAAMILIKLVIGLSLPWICVFLAIAHAYGFFLVNYYIISMNMENRYIAKGLMLLIPYILQAAFAAIALAFCNTYISRAAGAAIGILLCGIVASLIIIKEASPKINIEQWKYALRISLPAIIGSVSAMIMQQCDKVMITSISGAEVNATYSLIYYIGYILLAVQQATNGGWQVWLYNTLNKKMVMNIAAVQKWYMYAMLVLATGLYMVAPEIIMILSPSDYWHFEYVVPFVIGSYLMFMYSIQLSVVQYNKKTGVISVIVSVGAAINIALNYMLIPTFGGVGAAYTSLVSYIFIFIVSGVYLKLTHDYYFNDFNFLINIAIVIAMGVVFYFVSNLVILRYTVFLALLFAEALYLFIKRHEITSLFGGRILARN